MIAVVILNWNGVALLRRYLPQVIATTPTDIADVVVADNGSTDESLAVLSNEFPQVKVLAFDNNYGFAGGYNRVLKQLNYEYVVLLNSDVAPAEGWLQPLLNIMQANENVAACAPIIMDDKQHDKFEYAGAAGGFIDYLGYPFCRGRIFDSIETNNGQYNADIESLWVSGAALMVRRNIYNQLGGLDESFFAHMEEIDLCWRMRNAGWRIVACSKSMVFHLGGATLSAANPRKTYLNFRNNLAMLIKNYNSRNWVFVFIARLLLDGVAGLKFLTSAQAAHCWAIVRAHWAVFARIRTIIHQRHSLEPMRSRELPLEIYQHSIVVDYYLHKKHTFSELAQYK